MDTANSTPGASTGGQLPSRAVTSAAAPNMKNVMGKYDMDMSDEGKMGEGSFSVCRKGKIVSTGQDVGVKIFKAQKGSKASKSEDATRLLKFVRQIEVLSELQKPFVKPSDPRLWAPQMDKAKPERLFMVLIDSSTDAAGKPGADPADNQMYVITELAQYSLKDFLSSKARSKSSLSKETVRDMTKAVVYVMAGLHAKGFVHLDLKPENLMVFDGALKLIDVDGCVKVGMNIEITNPSISFSPCYCSPEWADFLLSESDGGITAAPALDVWSLGATVCEFVTLSAILKPQYANFLRHSHSHREAGFLFMEWLSAIKKPPTPKSIDAFDHELADLVTNWMMVTDKNKRKTCAECLASCSYLTKAHLHHSKTNPLNKSGDGLEDDSSPMPKDEQRQTLRMKFEDNSSKAIHKGTLWKLNTGMDAKDSSQWLQRDMWVANNGSLCYFSVKDSKRLVLLDSHKLHEAEIATVPGSAREHAFQIKCNSNETADEEGHIFVFAAESAAALGDWLRYLKDSHETLPTMRLGASYGIDLKDFMLTVRNRRLKVDTDSKSQFEPMFEGTIWKLKAAGDAMKQADWFSRRTWLSQNGSLVYWSVRDSRELIYYTTADVRRAAVAKIPDSESAKPFSFEVQLPPNEGMDFQKGVFAAESAELRDKWISEFASFASIRA